MKSNPRSRLQVERLESRDVPSATATSSSSLSSALPSGWSQWSNDGSTVFENVAGAGINGSTGIQSSGASTSSGLAWASQTEPGDTKVSVDVQLNSLVPTMVFSDGTNIGTTTPSYLAAVVARGANVSLIQVVDGQATVLASVASPSSSYFSGNWVQVSLVPNGSSVAVQVVRQDTGQYLNPSGGWQTAATSVIDVGSSLAETAGVAGIGRLPQYAGTVDLANFSIQSPPPTSPLSLPPAVSQKFDTTAVGATPAGWQDWISNSAGTAGVSSAQALSSPDSYAFTGASNTSERAWSTTALPAAVSASAAIELNSLIPAEIFVNGSDLNSTTPTYDAVSVTRGLQANLIQVVDGQTTTLATVNSAAYMTAKWVQVQLTAEGSNLIVTIYRTDTDQWLTAKGTWSSTPAYAFNVTNATPLEAGYAGIGREASYAGSIAFDNFTAGSIGSVGPAVTASSSAGSSTVSGSVTFQANVSGSVSEVAFVLNGTVEATFTSSQATWTLNTKSLANGAYTLTVLAGGTDGTVGLDSDTFTVANTLPPPVASQPSISIASNPTAAEAYAPVPSADTLFGPGGPSDLDVDQGAEGDCWLIASLAEVAVRDPQAIVNMFTYDGSAVENGSTVGVYTVRFYNSNGVAKYVKIDDELPQGGNYYDHPVNGVMWVALAEKAYAIANGLGYVNSFTPDSNSYDALNSGYANWALQAIANVTASDTNVFASQIASAWNAGDFVVLSTISPSSSYIVGDHDYAVVGYSASTGLYQVLNPWGGSTSSDLCIQDSQVYGLFSANASFIAANFSSQFLSAESIGVAVNGQKST